MNTTADIVFDKILDNFSNLVNKRFYRPKLPRSFEISFLYDLRTEMILFCHFSEYVCVLVRKYLCAKIDSNNILLITTPNRDFTPRQDFFKYSIKSDHIDVGKFTAHFKSPLVEYYKNSSETTLYKINKNIDLIKYINSIFPLCEEIDNIKGFYDNMLYGLDELEYSFPDDEYLNQLLTRQKVFDFGAKKEIERLDAAIKAL